MVGFQMNRVHLSKPVDATASAGYFFEPTRAILRTMSTQTAEHTPGILGDILNLSGLGYWQFDLSAQHMLASPECIALLGAVQAGTQPLTIEDFQALVHPHDWPGVLALLNVSTVPALSVMRFRVASPYGAWHWLEA
jgi:hypothetical protein